jgi:hypothetical protein
MIINQLVVISILVLEDMVLIKIHLINLIKIYIKIKQEHIIKHIHKEVQKKEKDKIL